MWLIEKIEENAALCALVAATTAAGSTIIIQRLRGRGKRKIYSRKISERSHYREEVFSKLEEKLLSISDEESRRICDIPLDELCKLLQSKELTATQVLKAYQKQMLKAQSQTNCVTDVVLEADQMAIDLDSTTRPKGPLHGVPISLKESIQLKDYDVTLGCGKFLGHPCDDSDLAKLLKSMGAIPFVKTNVPQLLFSCECTNPVYGHTVNPGNAERSPGGSSGGEAALLALGASALGFGSDIGGSVRIPAAHCGLYTMKVTSTRICSGGINIGVIEQSLRTSFGPMCRRMADLEYISRNLLTSQFIDKTLPPLSFNENLLKTERQLRIGYYTRCCGVDSSVSHKRAIHEVIHSLGNKHQFVEFDFPYADEYRPLYHRALTAGCGISPKDILAHEQVEPMYQRRESWLHHLPLCIRYALAMMSNRFSYLVRQKVLSSEDLLRLAADIENWRRRVLDAWQEADIDLMLSPVFGIPAPHTYQSLQHTSNFAFTACYNLLDAAVGAFPVTKVTEEDVGQSIKTNSYPAVMKGAEGLSIGLQIAAKPYEEELCLNFMRQVEQSLSKQ